MPLIGEVKAERSVVEAHLEMQFFSGTEMEMLLFYPKKVKLKIGFIHHLIDIVLFQRCSNVLKKDEERAKRATPSLDLPGMNTKNSSGSDVFAAMYAWFTTPPPLL